MDIEGGNHMKRTVLVLLGLAAAAVAAVFALLPGYLEKNINKVLPHEPYGVSAEAQENHKHLIVADLHSDTLLWARDPLERASRGHVDVPRLVDGNVAIQVFAAVTKVPPHLNYDRNTGERDQITQLVMLQRWPVATWSSLYQRALYIAGRLDRAAAAAPDKLHVIRDQADLDMVLKARASGRQMVGGLLATEGLHPLEGDLANIQHLYDAGYRMMGLLHFFDNELGGSLHGVSHGGLTDFGKQAVGELERLGIIVDLAHSSPAVVDDVLAMAAKPVIVSHTGVKGTCDSARNLDDARMKRIAATGGLIGIGYWDGAVCDPSPASIVKAIRYAVDLVGAEHVALGSDYDGGTTVAFDTSEIAVLTGEMRKAGFSEEEIAGVMGGNVVRLLRRMLPPA
jgi:microsomal dipeptidase-like Zn-dependent dipeptidase